MNDDMKNRFRVFRRGWGTFYCEDLVTKKQTTLKTRDKAEAYRLVAAKNETEDAPAFSLQLARVYWKAGDPAAAKRTWQNVMDEIPKLKYGDTQHRWHTAIKDKAFDSIRDRVVLETQAEHFLKVLENNLVSTNVFLRRIHNSALDMNWLPWPILPKKRWPAVKYKEKRGITLEEHQAIVEREKNPERKAFYQLAWHLGASQSDIAFLDAKNIDWENRVISFARKKTGSVAIMRFDDEMAEVLRSLPLFAPSFPICGVSAPPTGGRSSNNAARDLASRESPCTATDTHGRNAPRPPAIQNGSRRRPWATTARPSTAPMLERPKSNFRFGGCRD